MPIIQTDHGLVLQAEDRQRVFIEAGAFDGSLLSNSIYLELKYNWTGLLVEPDPKAFKIMKGKNEETTLFRLLEFNDHLMLMELI